MIYKKFHISNYKAIEKIDININREIVPLIGINESGKTTILQAILAFDKNKDNLLNKRHIDAKNIYEHEEKECVISAELEFKNKEEFEDFGKSISINMDMPLYDWIKDKFENHEPITLKRDFANGILTKEYSLVEKFDEFGSEHMKKKFISEIVKRLPNILYFDDFSDRVPEAIKFPQNYVNDQKLSTGKEREWQEILVEVFGRAIDAELSLVKFMKLDNDDKREDYLSDVNDKLNEEIITDWEHLKKLYEGFDDGEDKSQNIELALKYDNHEKTFQFKIKDRETERSRTFDILERSKGFQWFFNFNMKLKYNSKYSHHPDDAIYLLDEPGSYLHSAAQTGLLKKLKEISSRNTIIFCTHSQYLLEPSEINIGSVKIVSKNEGTIDLTDFGSSSVQKSLGAYTPIVHALHLKYGFNTKFKKCLLTEGIYDYYFFSMFFNLRNIDIIPGQGASHLKDLISILISFSDKFLVILDNDEEGQKAKANYSKYFKRIFDQNSYIYDIKQGDFVLEDILSGSDCEKIIKNTGCKDVKSALPILFFDSTDNAKLIKKEFSEETKDNITKIEGIIKSHFN
ncbi:MAG: AAA family ATPase [Clostridia bacterium]|nr:AAA family ATPase [Clostridia bacterium]